MVIERDDLAIDNSAVREATQRFNDVGKPAVQGFSIPRIDGHCAAGFHRDRSVAIQLDLPNPLRAIRQLWHGQAVHRLNKTGLRTDRPCTSSPHARIHRMISDDDRAKLRFELANANLQSVGRAQGLQPCSLTKLLQSRSHPIVVQRLWSHSKWPNHDVLGLACIICAGSP
jgi:hypothetical protein